MTLPVSGPISMSQVNTELLITPSTTTITMNDSGVRFLTGTSTGTTDSMQQLLGKSYVIAANSGILTSGSSYALPATSGTTIKVLAIAGGAGGGGGSSRSYARGYLTGGGGGGAGGNAYTTVSVTPGQTVYFSIGGSGAGGASRDGIYGSGGSGGSAGGTTTITVNSSNVAVATGGSGGQVSENPTRYGGAAGGASAGSALVTPVAGQNAPDDTQVGGYGGNGYTINTSVGATTILTSGSTAAGANGPYGGPATAGVAYGGGGGAGGTAQSDVGGQQNGAWISAAGYQGAVFIWWGY